MDCIDLTEDSTGSSTGKAYASQDEKSRKRIMELAARVNESLGIEHPRVKRARIEHGPTLPNSMQHLQVSPQPQPQPVQQPPAPPESSNSLLSQLHKERLARLSAGERQALASAHHGSSASAQDASHRPYQQGATAGVRSSSDSGVMHGHVAAIKGALHHEAAARNIPASTSGHSAPAPCVTLLSYNLWFQEDVCLVERMAAVGDVIQQAGLPDFLLFQEVTPNMLRLWAGGPGAGLGAAWWRHYHCSPVPSDRPYFTLLLARRATTVLPGFSPWVGEDYPNTVMGRGILYTRASVGGRPLVVATTHLESPVGEEQQYVHERREQLGKAVQALERMAGPGTDIVLAGDMNWQEPRDGQAPLPDSWRDAWPALMPHQPGLTWDPAANPMIASSWKGARLDRVFCRLAGWQLASIEMVGRQALAGLTYTHAKTRTVRPVLPSDHFGLLVKLMPAGVHHATGPQLAAANGLHATHGAHAATAMPQPAAPPSTLQQQPRRHSGGRQQPSPNHAHARGPANAPVVYLADDPQQEDVVVVD